MISKEIEQLMWQEIDGTITPADRERLERFMSEQADSREFYDDLVQFSDMLGRVEEIDPGPALRERVEGSIDPLRFASAATPAPNTEYTKPAKLFAFRPGFRYAMAAAAGLMIGVIGYHLVNSERIDPRKLRGTVIDGKMIGEHTGTESSRLRIDLDGVEGTVDFRLDDGTAIAEVRVASRREIGIGLVYGGQSLTVTNPGPEKYYAVFRKEDEPASPLAVRITAGGETLLAGQVLPQ